MSEFSDEEMAEYRDGLRRRAADMNNDEIAAFLTQEIMQSVDAASSEFSSSDESHENDDKRRGVLHEAARRLREACPDASR